MININHVCLTHSLIITVLGVAFPSYAMAQDHTVELSGTLEGSCSFNTDSNGELAFTPEESPTTITSGENPALVTVNCNTDADLKVFDPDQTDGPEFQEDSKRAWLRFGDNQIESDQGETLKIPSGEEQVEVGLEVVSQNPLETGTYTYTVEITATTP